METTAPPKKPIAGDDATIERPHSNRLPTWTPSSPAVPQRHELQT